MPILTFTKGHSGLSILSAIVLLLVSQITYAQNSGTVIYKETMKLHFTIQGDAPPPPNLPTERSAQMILYFTPDASLYINDPSANNEGDQVEEEMHNGETVRIRMGAPDNRTYCDLRNSKQVSQVDFMQRKFLIEKDIQSSDWKLTGNQKTILNYPCQEATRQDKDRKITVWFTPAVPISSGPSSYTGLPGLVLEVNINDSDQTITATSVNFGEVAPANLEKPKDGKKVTQEEFEKIREEKMKEMGIDNPNGGNVIIRIEER